MEIKIMKTKTTTKDIKLGFKLYLANLTISFFEEGRFESTLKCGHCICFFHELEVYSIILELGNKRLCLKLLFLWKRFQESKVVLPFERKFSVRLVWYNSILKIERGWSNDGFVSQKNTFQFLILIILVVIVWPQFKQVVSF